MLVFQKKIIRWSLASWIPHLWESVGGSEIDKREKSNCRAGHLRPWPTPPDVLEYIWLGGPKWPGFIYALRGDGGLQ